jgi:hypothetical protein
VRRSVSFLAIWGYLERMFPRWDAILDEPKWPSLITEFHGSIAFMELESLQRGIGPLRSAFISMHG